MKFLADECVYHITVKTLRNWGHDVLTVQEVGLVGHENGDILTYAVGSGRIPITNDMHFSNIIIELAAPKSRLLQS
jgi:predicted nuclease of predicted toxin-antitoxin system